MAKRTAQALYTITLVEVTYDVDEYVEVPAGGEQMQNGYHLRARRGQTIRPMHIRMGRHETRTALLVDVPAGELADARRAVECGVETVIGERYIVTERQRGRIIRETSRNRAA